MNQEQLNNIIKKYYNYDDMLKYKYKINKEKNYDAIIIAPTWRPEFVFDKNSFETVQLKRGRGIETYDILGENKEYLFMRIGKGMTSIYDNMLLLGNYDCPFVFIGSAGSLKQEIVPGDILVPSTSIAGPEVSTLFDNSFNPDDYKNKFPSDRYMLKIIHEICLSLGYELKIGTVLSINSIIGEYFHFDNIVKLGYDAVEQETAAFNHCLQILDKTGIPLLCISDNSLQDNHYNAPFENKEEYLETREKKLQKIITRI